ncbi:MAG: (2E,6E)-farnesyl diphosphate synthase [Gammaproteobacteria bacterium]|nr:(2E,6E)-farnesyl diphosphate synthase [Thiotrichales bacterium]OUU55071.1 MAG: (2E,6E)-farnesyl diphosphate synthase [Proteobacteria bacterium TMED61]
MSLKTMLPTLQARTNAALNSCLPSETIPPKSLHAAMRYSALAPGKRLRPALVYVTGMVFGGADSVLDAAAASVELIHAYSLIHDDLPAMDDDDLRRGRLTCHKQFDEATAILAGDALQALAFESLINNTKGISAEIRIEMLRVLTHASGPAGMAGGQALDLDAVGQTVTLSDLELIHRHKTGDLITASVLLGYLSSAQDDSPVRKKLQKYSECVGLAFQVQDDILDVEGTTEELGKPQGSDEELEKPTYPNLLGMSEAKKTALRLRDNAIQCLQEIEQDTSTLEEIADFIIFRNS